MPPSPISCNIVGEQSVPRTGEQRALSKEQQPVVKQIELLTFLGEDPVGWLARVRPVFFH